MENKKYTKGFTLSELLITIGIIGIIAALTIPNIIKNTQRKDLEAAFQKSYTLLSQTLLQMKADDGSVYQKFTTAPNNSSTAFKNAMRPYFKIINSCSPESNCPPTNATSYRNYTNTASFMNSGHLTIKFYIEDGMLISPLVSGTILVIWVDVNGYNKGPNRAGYDLFAFQLLTNDVFVPMGSTKSNYAGYCSTLSNSNSSGFGCANNALSVKDYFKNLP